MDLRIVANYAATDGSMPESAEIEWSGIDQAANGMPALTVIDDSNPASMPVAMLDRLLTAPALARAALTVTP